MLNSKVSNSKVRLQTRIFAGLLICLVVILFFGVMIEPIQHAWASGIQFPAYGTISNGGIAVTQRNKLNLINGGCVDNAGTASTDCTFAATGGGGLITYAALGVVLSGGTTPVFVPLGGDGLGSTTEAAVNMKVQPIAAISNMCVTLSAGPGGADSITVTLRANGANKAVTVTITGAATSACDSTHTFTNAAGDLMDWSIVPSTTIASYTPNVMISAQFGSVSAGSVNAGTQFQIAQYATAGSTLSGVSITDCPDTGGNHLNRIAATGVWSCGTSGATRTASYLNLGSSGNRAGAIIVSVAGFTFSGSVDSWVGGAPPTVINSGFFANGQTVTSSFTVTFDFGPLSPIITEAKYFQDNATAQGVWKWQGSTDNMSYTDIGSSFTLGGSTAQTITTLSGNTTAYRYYRLTGVSGTTSSSPFVFGCIFKIAY